MVNHWWELGDTRLYASFIVKWQIVYGQNISPKIKAGLLSRVEQLSTQVTTLEREKKKRCVLVLGSNKHIPLNRKNMICSQSRPAGRIEFSWTDSLAHLHKSTIEPDCKRLRSLYSSIPRQIWPSKFSVLLPRSSPCMLPGYLCYAPFYIVLNVFCTQF